KFRRVLSDLDAQEKINPLLKGFSEEIPRTFAKGTSAIGQLFGNEIFPGVESTDPQSASEMLGQALGKGIGYGAMAAPFVAGSEAIIPGIIGTLGGSALAGAALSPSGERLSGAAEFAAPVAAIKAIEPLAKFGFKSALASMRKVTPEKTYNKIVDKYDEFKGALENIFDFVSKQAKERGISQVSELPDEVIDTALSYGSKTRSFQSLAEKARTGDYDAIRKFYTQLGEIERKAAKAKDWEKEDIFSELKQMINEGLESHFAVTGHKDLAQWLNHARNGWRDLKQTFESPHMPAIRKLVGENREFPTSLTPLLKKSVSREKLFKAVPELQKDIETYLQKESFKKAWEKAKKLGITSSALFLGGKLTGKSESPYSRD